jgi:hypothetical protein
MFEELHYKANKTKHMPIRQQATPLLAFGFDSRNCVTCPGSSDKHSKIVVRIRKDDLARLESDDTHGMSQIYVRVPAQESLSVDVGRCISIQSKKRALSFEVSSIHVLTSITSQTRFYRTAVLSGRFA